MKFYTRKKRLPAVIIVSLIDILAILLIFVIVTTTFKRDQPEVMINLPESRTAAAARTASEPAVLTISKDEKVFLDAKPVVLETLKSRLEDLEKSNPGRGLALNADKETPFGFVIKVLDVLKSAGVKNTSAFTEPIK